VWPFSTGEVTLQNYNFFLTLNKLYEFSDGLILLENDILHQICKRIDAASSSKPTDAKKEITFNDLNSIIGHKLASVLQPSSDSHERKNYLNEILIDLCCDVDFKLLSLNNLPHMNKQSIEFSSFKWNGLYKSARQLLFTGGFMDEGLNWNDNGQLMNKTLALALFARGKGDDDTGQSENLAQEHSEYRNYYFDETYLSKYFSTNLFGSLLSKPVKVWQQPRLFMNYEKSLALLSNSQLPVFKIETLLGKAWKMFSAKAYVHQYLRYENFEEEQILNSLMFAQQLVKNYKKF
jgi:tubulin delta